METNNDHKSPEQVTDDYYKALIVQNEALKQQNEELIEQTTKLQADKDKLALMLERIHLMFLNRDMRETSAVIKQTLSECGY